jgi:hypothetical protein
MQPQFLKLPSLRFLCGVKECKNFSFISNSCYAFAYHKIELCVICVPKLFGKKTLAWKDKFEKARKKVLYKLALSMYICFYNNLTMCSKLSVSELLINHWYDVMALEYNDQSSHCIRMVTQNPISIIASTFC